MGTLREVAQQVRDRANIVEFIQGYVELRRAGSQWKGICPFHREKTPSFHVHPARQGWHCFGCGKGGSIIDFVMMIEKLEFVEALEFLARRLGIEMPNRDAADSARAKKNDQKRDSLLGLNQWALRWFRGNLKAEPHSTHSAYVGRRGIQPAMVEAFQIGSAPDVWRGLLDAAKAQGFAEDLLIEAGLVVRSSESGNVYDRFRGRLIFPIHDHLGRCIGFGGRIVVDDPEKKLAKYINSSETPLYRKGRSLYGLFQAQQAIEKKGRAILVEGYLDCIMCHQGGFSETVASLGTALTPEQARLLRRFCREIIFVYDGDEAGQQAMKRGAEVLVAAGLQARAAVLPPEDDPDSLIRREGSEGFARFLEKSEDIFDFFLRRSLPTAGTAQIGQRIAAVDSVAPLLLAIEDPVEKNLRLKAVAALVGVDPPAIQAFLARRAKRSPSVTDTVGTSPAAPAMVSAQLPPTVHHIELGILRGIIENETFMQWVEAHIDPAWVDPEVADIIRQIMDRVAGGNFDPVEFYSSLEGRSRNLFADVLYNDTLIPPQDPKEFAEIRTRLIVRHLKQCTQVWLDSCRAMMQHKPEEPPSPEALEEFQRMHREAQDYVRSLERKTLVVQSAVRAVSM